MSPIQGRQFVIGVELLYLILLQFSSAGLSHALQIRMPLSPRAAVNCKEVLSKNLECPSIGAYPVAGACDYFARCIQTENGVESEVDFCPDGHIYVINRCIRSHNLNKCPQKDCALLHPSSIIDTVVEQTTARPSAIVPAPTNVDVWNPRPTFATKRPLQNLHPSISKAERTSPSITFFSFLLTTLLAINKVL